MVYVAVAVMLVYGVAFLLTAGLCVAAGRADAAWRVAMARRGEGGGR